MSFYCPIAGSIESLVVKFADGGPKKRQQSQQNHGITISIYLYPTILFKKGDVSRGKLLANNILSLRNDLLFQVKKWCSFRGYLHDTRMNFQLHLFLCICWHNTEMTVVLIQVILQWVHSGFQSTWNSWSGTKFHSGINARWNKPFSSLKITNHVVWCKLRMHIWSGMKTMWARIP